MRPSTNIAKFYAKYKVLYGSERTYNVKNHGEGNAVVIILTQLPKCASCCACQPGHDENIHFETALHRVCSIR